MSYTQNYNFEKIDFNVRPWDQKEWSNWDLLDRVLSTISTVPGNKGTWSNSTAYVVGDKAFDPDALVFYNCNIAHTSPATGSFTAARLANPTYWTIVDQSAGSVRYDLVQALTPVQKAQAIANMIGFTPVQQATGIGQTQNIVKMGWNGAGKLKATVDVTDLGAVWTDSIGRIGFASSDYMKLPNGLIVQWGSQSVATSQYLQAFPIAFPTAPFVLLSTPIVYSGTPSSTYIVTVDAISVGSANFRCYNLTNGGALIGQPSLPVAWIALGY